MRQVSRASTTTPAPQLTRAIASWRRWLGSAVQALRQSLLPDVDAPPTPRAQHPPLPLGGSSVLGLVVVVLASLLLAGTLMTLAVRVRYDAYIYPGIQAGQVAVGGQTLSAARTLLADHTERLEHGLVTFHHGDRSWTPTLEELGATVDVDATLADAYETGRDGNRTARALFPGTVLAPQQSVPLAVAVDLTQLDTWFDEMDRALRQGPVDARIEVDGAAVTIVAARDGLVVDRGAALAEIRRVVADGMPVTIDLPTTVASAEVRAGHLESTRAMLAGILANPVVATFEDQAWTIPGELLGPYLTVEASIDGGELATDIVVDEAGFAGVLRAVINGTIDRQAVDAQLGWEDGKGIVVRAPAVEGVMPDAVALAHAVTASFLRDHEAVEVPVLRLAPRIDGTNLAALGIETVVGRGDSNFSGGDEGRDANVEVAAGHLHGTLVEPGGVFSFNAAIGEISYDRGYVGALVAGADGVITDAGGGACQVSTTVFRAALTAGFPIMERYAHTVRIPNYELDNWGPGFDASILQEGPDPAAWPDFKFRNDTGGWLLVEAEVSYPRVEVTIYGTDPGRSVSFETATLGAMAFAVTRVITDADGTVVAEDTFTSYYEG